MHDQVISVIYEAIDEHNASAPPERQLEPEPSLILFGYGGRLDSLDLVSLVLSVEDRVSHVFGKPITLTDERAMSERRSPFRTVQSLSDYVEQLLSDVADD